MKEYTPSEVYPLTSDDSWKQNTGSLPVKMVNDYLFRVLLQSDNEVLKGLLASLLHIDVSKITSAVVANPILLGKHIDAKTYILDVRVDFNDAAQINLEMQVIRESWWEDRSILYIARLYDTLNRGTLYKEIKTARQIAFCNFTLNDKFPEFYATYRVRNDKPPHHVYSDKFILSNVDLTRIDLATEEDRKYHLDDWARFFAATTWEELKMIAQKNATIELAVSDMWQVTQDQMIMEQCLAREEYIANEKYKNEKISKLEAELDQAVEQKERAVEQQKKAEEEKSRAVEQQLKAEEEKSQAVEQQLKAEEEKSRAVEQLRKQKEYLIDAQKEIESLKAKLSALE